MKHRIPGARVWLNNSENVSQGYSSPLSDRAPALDAIMTRNLGSTPHGAQPSEREIARPIHETVHAQRPIRELVCGESPIGRVSRIIRSVAAELR
jgi:hypothetical protein